MITWLSVLCTVVQLLLNPPDIRRMTDLAAGVHAPASEVQGGNLKPDDGHGQTQDTEVYITARGQCYHRRDCSYLGENVKSVPLKEAATKYRPCSRCKPPVLRSP